MDAVQKKPTYFSQDTPASEWSKDLNSRMTLADGLSKRVDFVGECVVLEDRD